MQGLEWNSFVLIEEQMQLSNRNSKIALIEIIVNVPTKWAKVSSLLNNSMEHTKSK